MHLTAITNSTNLQLTKLTLQRWFYKIRHFWVNENIVKPRFNADSDITTVTLIITITYIHASFLMIPLYLNLMMRPPQY